MENWFESQHCMSRAHCKNCRLSIDFRKWAKDNFAGIDDANFECPFGITDRSVKQQFPPLHVEAANAATALGRAAKRLISGKNVKVDKAEHTRRLEICKSNKCKQYHRKQGRCLKCGCVAKWKTRLESESCPLGFWKKETEPDPKGSPSLTHGWKARAMVLSTIRSTLGKQLQEACEKHHVKLELGGIPGSYGQQFRKPMNIITWGVKVATWWYHRNRANVLYMENGLLAQRHGIWVDARGWFSESNLCKHRHYDEPYTKEDLYVIKHIVKNNFKWDMFEGGDPNGPIMYVIQSAKDAPCRFHFPERNRTAHKENTIALGLKLLQKYAPDRKIIVRPHPRFKDQWRAHEDTYKKYFREGWEVDWSPNVYATLKQCSGVIGINSTTLTEALALGIPVAAIGESAFTGGNVVLECAHDLKRLKYFYDWQPERENVLKYLAAIVRDHELRFRCSTDAILKNREFNQWIERKL